MQISLIYAISLILGLLITIFLTPKILLVSVKKRILDIPDCRKIHTQTSSCLGGVAFFPSLFITICAINIIYFLFDYNSAHITTPWLLMSLGAGFLMYIVGFSDDINGISYRIKFIYQIFTSLLIIASGTWINNLYGVFGIHEIPMWIGFPITLLFIVFIINAINLIDGIDGLSSGLCIIALLFYGAIFVVHNQPAPAIISFATAGSLLGFFRYNFFGFPHSSIKIFMGDTGTLFLGTIISLLALKLLYLDDTVSIYKSKTEILIAYSVLIVPCFDVIRVMLHRYRNNKPLFYPDNNHLHHKLLALGLSTKQTLYIILSFSVLITFFNMLLNLIVALEYVVIFDVILWTVLNILITKKAKKTHA